MPAEIVTRLPSMFGIVSGPVSAIVAPRSSCARSIVMSSKLATAKSAAVRSIAARSVHGASGAVDAQTPGVPFHGASDVEVTT